MLVCGSSGGTIQERSYDRTVWMRALSPEYPDPEHRSDRGEKWGEEDQGNEISWDEAAHEGKVSAIFLQNWTEVDDL